jgi:septin 7
MSDYTSPTAETAEHGALSPGGHSATSGGINSSSSANHQQMQQQPLNENGGYHHEQEDYPSADMHQGEAMTVSRSAAGGMSVKSIGNGVGGHHEAGAAEMVRKKMGSFVGFANLPNQVHRKSVR